MKILVANPNTSTGVTDRLVAAGRLVASPGTELLPMTAAHGVPYIATRAEAAVGAVAALEMLAERRGEIDAAIVAAFGDPGLGGARELFDFPVVGMAEAAMLTRLHAGPQLRHRELRQGAGTLVRRDRGLAWADAAGAPPSARSTRAFARSTTCRTRRNSVLVDLANSTVPERCRRRRHPGRRTACRHGRQGQGARSRAARRRHPGRRRHGRRAGAPEAAQGHCRAPIAGRPRRTPRVCPPRLPM